MRIGEAARRSGTTIKAIRYYESQGLVGPLTRVGSYRMLAERDVQRVKLIVHCRSLGFGLEEIRDVIIRISDAAPDCPDPVSMMHLVARRLNAVQKEVSRLEDLRAQLLATRDYLAERIATAS